LPDLEPPELEPLNSETSEGESSLSDMPSHSFAGSIQVNYLTLPTAGLEARETVLDATTVEMSLKIGVDISKDVSASVKVCLACHGLEVGRGYIEVRRGDALRLRAGRFTPAFGDFPSRHDPANHMTSDKPLPYDMGRMVQLDEWNMSVLPAPWVDNGIELSGTLGRPGATFDYAVYAVGGPKGGNEDIDFDFVESRSPSRFYVDNNSRPSLGARIAGNFDLSSKSNLTIGASGFGGHYSTDGEQSFLLLGVDAMFWSPRLILRGEYLLRRTEMFIGSDPDTRFKFGPNGDGDYDSFFTKDGFYAEAELPIRQMRFLARLDGMRRRGNVLQDSLLSDRSSVYRYTVAVAYAFVPALTGKVSGQLYQYSDFDDEVAMQFALVAAF